MSEAIVVVDLGFGDAGKGTITDFLVRDRGAALVVRFNGGAQAGHNVVTPDGRHHTFAQLGAGTFVDGVGTHLGPAFLLHPGGLLVEVAHLAAKSVPDALDRLTIDGRARVITPFQQAAGRLRELQRGDRAHGTCGVGIGECAADAGLDDAIVAADLADPARLRVRLARQQDRKRAEFRSVVAGVPPARAEVELALLDDLGAVERTLAAWAPARTLRVLDADAAAARLRAPRTVVFEGAQGVLLDETWGFHPHTTWSDCTPRGARALAGDRAVTVLGVTRAYMVRHGPGPFPTDGTLAIPELHNGDGGWQGRFRTGALDLPLLAYAARACAGLDGVAVTCLDRVPARVPVRTEQGLEEVERDAIPGLVADAIGAPARLLSSGPTAREKRYC